jgi:GNAT superfamily N-acetyltransferase
VTAATEPLASRALGPADAEAALALSREAGWNQTTEDWRFMLAAGEARGQVTATGTLVASALIVPYAERIGWIAMVLTSKRHQRRGLASDNLRWAIERCDARGLIAGLDATPAGREVYAPLGFGDLWGLQRLRAESHRMADPAAHGAVIRPMHARDLLQAVALDAEAFGAERGALLAHLWQRRPGLAWVADRGGRLAGFVLGRDGLAATHLGPLIAADTEIATALCVRALAEAAGPVSIDVPDGQNLFRARLLATGFAPVRPFTRMLRRSALAPGQDVTFAIAGPELA